MTLNDVKNYIEPFGETKNIEGMARFGIDPKNALGTGMKPLRELAKKIKKDDSLADELWRTDIHELMILAVLIKDPGNFTEEQADEWAGKLYSWDVCDQFSMQLMPKTGFAQKKIFQWAEDDREFVRRAAFATMATMGLKRIKADDSFYDPFFPLIIKYSTDERNFVKKAVNWALRQIGKRNMELRTKAIETAVIPLKVK